MKVYLVAKFVDYEGYSLSESDARAYKSKIMAKKAAARWQESARAESSYGGQDLSYEVIEIGLF